MKLFWEFFSFELKVRLKSASTYVYFAMWFFFSFLSVAAEDFITTGNGKQLLNGPYSNTILYMFFTLFGTIVIAAIFGTSILRDFQRDTFQLIFTKPITKFAYLGGRWAGSFVTCVFAFSGIVFGEALGSLMPWADHTRIASGHIWWYVQPFLSIVVVQIFFLGSIFFLVAALSRKIVIVYLQGIAVLMIYLLLQAVFSATRSLEHFWSGILDPIGLQLASVIARYWTVAEKNSLLFSWSAHVGNGVFLYNRLLWIAVGFVSLGAVYRFFPMSVEELTAKSQGRRAAKAKREEAAELQPRRSLVAALLPRVRQNFGSGLWFTQLVSMTRLRISNITHELLFWALGVLIAFFSLVNGYFAGHAQESNVWPVTFLMLQSVEGLAVLLLYVVATIYAGELVWRERDTRFAGIHDALPMRETTDWLSKFFALAFVELVLLCVIMICGIVMQTFAGFYQYDLLQYFQELFLIVFPGVMGIALLAFFVQTVVSNKFLGHAIVLGVFVMQPILNRWNIENTLLVPTQTPSYTYSDMNGYGHFVAAQLWANVYWISIFAFLAVLSIALSRRGAENGWRARWGQARHRLPRLTAALVIFVLLAIGSGSWYFYNTHVLNTFYTQKQLRDFQAQYERDFKKYERLPQPKIIAVDANIDLDPYHRSFSGTGHFVLQNKTPNPIQQIHITDQMQSVSDVQFDRPFHHISSSVRDLYSIYQLETPLAPGEKLNMTFKVGYQSHGFRDGGERPELAYSGMFFDSSYFPTIGYSTDVEIDDPRRRREEKLPLLEDLPPRGDPYGSVTNLFTPNSDWISYHTTVSTPDDQIALAPGYLQRDWHQNGRHYFSYDMGDVKILDFFSYISGRYTVKKENYKGTNIEIYYDYHHPWNVDDMTQAARAGLDYYQANYSPFQYKQFRIIEFPRYRGFAQSFSNTSPFTETFFLSRVLDPKKDIDFTYFVTAHELAHQWWAHQLIGGRVAGSNMMSESLAEYSALRVAEKKYGDAQMRKFLSHELDGYLRGRSGETRKEPPLGQVQREAYVWYQKGSLILYALSDYIGEDKLNLALHNFLMQYRYANADDSQSGPYPDTRQLEDALRAQTPADLQYFIDDSFEKITLYDNKAIEATSQKTADGKYKVTLIVEGKKAYADGNGVETPTSINDLIDVGVFSGKKGEEQPLSVRKERITGGRQTFEFIVNEQPTRAGIDPYNKLIDRNLDDNSMDVSNQK
ncbi:M1 family aminopeptidase [Granulicella sp. S156]|uniref:ABC transporter permease/M1 family aminopeptidase n=1 Tax=Granulicella sp. S156 TaxID=1747224 RepID=UPI00131E190F|nr:M1 family aminopeptidase [Granulicella sp. S156]